VNARARSFESQSGSSCLEKHHRGGGITYAHQLLGATPVHPDRKEVIPLTWPTER